MADRTRNFGLAGGWLDATQHIEQQRRHGDLWGQLVDEGCECPDRCECDEACEHPSYTFEDDGRKICTDCYGTLNEEDFDDDE